MIGILIFLACLVALILMGGAISVGCEEASRERRDAATLEASNSAHLERVGAILAERRWRNPQ